MFVKTTLRWSARALGLATASYGVYAGITWLRYGRPSRPTAEEEDALLNHFMPVYEVVERHHIEVDAPAAVTLAAACEIDLLNNAVVRGLISARELILGATADRRPQPRGLLAALQSMGWVVLAERPGEEIVGGAVTRPWEANVTFRSVPPEEFAAFNEPDYVKIAWTLRADAIGEAASIFRTETRVLATDRSARTRFRRYWALVSPGIFLIRQVMLRPIKTEAERTFTEVLHGGSSRGFSTVVPTGVRHDGSHGVRHDGSDG
jgi:hypothetical protein